MQDSVHPTRLVGRPRVRLLAAATLVSGILVAGCGGSSPNPAATTVAGASTQASRTAGTGPLTTAGSSAATSQGATTSAPTAPASGDPGLAFAECMRANGVPNFPDPSPGRGLIFREDPGVDLSSPAARAAQAKCRKLLPGGPPGPGSTTHPSAQTLAKLLRIAVCMREHGISQFPDPRTSVPSNPAGYIEITDFDGAILLFPSTINLQSPAYRHDLAACGAPPLGLPH